MPICEHRKNQHWKGLVSDQSATEMFRKDQAIEEKLNQFFTSVFNMDNLMKLLTGNFLLGGLPQIRTKRDTQNGCRETAHVALEVQQKGIPPSKADQKTTKNKTEVDKEQV